jgi:uncharacterized membrane protein
MPDHRTRSQYWADQITKFSGSWGFIFWFTAICIGWIVLNVSGIAHWDLYPFLFLNWIMTVVSTLQNPIILLSQNRQNEMDADTIKDIVRRLEALQNSIDKKV